MDSDRWKQVDNLLQAALERAPSERAEFLRQACSGDEALEREVRSLLTSRQEAGSFLERPAIELAARAIALKQDKHTPATAGSLIGQTISHYRITAQLGAGGMGEVYRARDTKLDRDVAIKMLPAAFAQDPERLARFEREAKVLASLNHPNIAQIYGVEERALIMELVEGETLHGPLPVETALNYAKQIADALEAAHEKGITHRDLKPGNVKIRPDGTVKVLDFGLAKVPWVSGVDSPDEATATLTTGAGMILGTAAYMSPEQAQGKPVDKRADIWAFGVVLYEMLTGRSVFQGETVSDTLAAVLTKEPEWERVPAKVRRLLQSCLQKDPKKRLQAIGDSRLLLEDQPQRMALRHRHLPWAAVSLPLAGVAIWGWLHTPPAEPRPVARWTATLPASDIGSGLAISRNGTRLAYNGQMGGSSLIWVRMLDQPEGRPIQGTEGGLRPFFSPDGQWLAYSQGAVGPLKKVPVTGGTPITLCDGARLTGGSWGEDGSIIFSGTNGLMRVSASGGTCESLTRPDPQKRELYNWPWILPGGQSILFTIGTTGLFDSARIAVLDLKSSGIRVLVNGASSARYVPSGHLVYVRGGTIFAVPFDRKRLVVTGSETPVIEKVFYNSRGGFADYTFSDSGLLVYRAETRTVTAGRTLEWLDRKGVAQALPAPPQQYTGVRLSPDGQRALVGIDFSEDSENSGGSRDIWIYELARGGLTRLTSVGSTLQPRWTPDGRRVAFASSVGNHGIYWVPADGSGRPELLLPSQALARLDSWTPDGKMLLYHSGTPARIWTLTTPGDGGESKPRLFLETSFNEFDAQVSPDGRWVAYTSDESGKNQVYARPFPGPGGKTSISIEGGQESRWSRDGHELFYRDPRKNQLMAVDIQTGPTFRAARPRALFELRTSYWDVALDGKRFLAVKEPQAVASEAKMEAVVNWFEELRQKAPPAGKR
jgi:Tol biopolymer transport system component/predicted Ser/Thr protein kinase